MTTCGVQAKRETQAAESKLQSAVASGSERRIVCAAGAYNRWAAVGGWTGVDPAQWVGEKRGRWLRWDTGEMAADDAQLREEVQALQAAGLPPGDMRRMLGLAGYAAADVSKALAWRGVNLGTTVPILPALEPMGWAA